MSAHIYCFHEAVRFFRVDWERNVAGGMSGKKTIVINVSTQCIANADIIAHTYAISMSSTSYGSVDERQEIRQLLCGLST